MNRLLYIGGLLSLALLAACRSPDAWRRQADEAAASHIADAQRKALGRADDFSVERPSDRLRKQLKLDAPGGGAVAPTGGVLRLTLKDCLMVGARNSREYQDSKEEVFVTALALDLQKHAFENSYAGLITGGASTDESQSPADRQAEGGASAGVTRKLRSGGTLAAKIGLDVVKLLTGDKSSSFGLLADATITLPMLKGSGRDIVTEPLTQAERDLVYSLWGFERYKKDFAVRITKGYLDILQSMEEVRNLEDNVRRLTKSLDRTEKLAQAGRMSNIETDQTRQNVLSAQNRLVLARLSVDRQLDAFKITLGLPTDLRLELDETELEGMARQIREEAVNPDALKGPAEEETLRPALEDRLDLRITRLRLEDARRKIKVAADALRAGLNLKLTASTQERRYNGTDTDDLHFSDGRLGLAADMDLPWERTAERNAYREQLLAADAAERSLEEKEDSVKQDVRNALRNLQSAIESYRIQAVAVELAERRVKSTDLFLEAGRAQIRDVLESEEDLVSARNALSQSLVSIRMARLELLRDTEKLEIDSRGIWIEKQ